jgi:hypothetical protein
VSIVNSQIYSNTAYIVRAHPQKFPMPRWETHVLLVVCRAVVSLSGEAQCCQSSTPKCIPTKLPMCALVFKSSHRPDGKMADMPKSTLI